MLSSLLIISLSVVEELYKNPPFQRKARSLVGSLFFPEETIKGSSKDIECLHNQNFSYTFTYLHIDSTQELNLSDYQCQPIIFGFSVSEGSSIFPMYHYPECSKVTGVNFSRLFIDRKSNLLSMDCEFPSTGYYFSGPVQGKSLMKKPNVIQITLKKYTQAVRAQNISFAAGVCSLDTELDKPRQSYELYKRYNIESADFQHGDMKPIFDQKLFDKNKKYVKGKPRIIFMMTLDSVSRRHFYRKLPKLVQYLNESETNLPHMGVYDFKLHSTFGSGSVENQVPIFSGRNPVVINNRFGYQDVLKNTSMWDQLKSKGYLTLMGLDDCDPWFPDVLGQSPKVDFSIRQFYCLLDVYGKIETELNFSEQRCFGPHQTHHYMLKYTFDLIKQYQGINMWIYLHLNAGHEKTGQHAATLDDDVTKFLKDLFYITKDKSEIFMFLGADHGMRYGEWHRSVEAFQETVLPSMFVIADKSLLDKYPYSYHSLSENSKRLTSKLDIRKTIFSLSNIKTEVPNAVDWIGEIASYSRNCDDLHSDKLFCACNKIREITEYNDTVRQVIEIITQRIEFELNNMTYYFPDYPIGQFCDQVILDILEKFYHISRDESSEIFKFVYKSSFAENFRLQVNLIISFSDELLNSYKSEFKIIELLVEDSTYFAKIIFISRLDKYDGKCQKLANENGISPEFCLRREC